MSAFSDAFSNRLNNTLGSTDDFVQNEQNTYAPPSDSSGSPGLLSSIVHNILGGIEGDIGGGLNYLGAFAKDQGSIDPDSSWNSLGDWLINNGTYLNNNADAIQQDYGTLNNYQNETILERLTDPNYLTDSRGLAADISNGLGSSIPFMAASMAMPELGIGGALARGLGGVAGRLGAKRLGSALASDLVQAGANDFARYALTSGPLEAAVNAGSIYDDLKNQGLSDAEIFNNMNSMIGDELPVDMLTSGLYGAVLGGNTFSRLGQGGWKRAIAANLLNTPADMAGEYMQEMTQQQLQNKYSGNPYGTFFNPTEDEMQAGRAAAMGALPMGLFGSFRGARHSHAAYQNALAPQVDPANPSAPVADTTDPVVEAQLTGKNDDVPTVDGQDVTNMSEDQFTNWFNSKVQAPQLDTSGVDVPQVQMPKTGGSGKAGAGANVLAAAQDFLGKQMANGTEGCVEAVTKIGARYNPFLASELNNGVVNVDQLVSDAGDAVIPFDPANVQAGDVIVYGDSNDPQQHVVLADGNGGYVGNSSSQNQVVQGDNYNEMGGLTPTKIIKTGNGVTASEASAENGDSAPAADLSNLPVGGIATAIAQNTGLPANLIWAQLAHESDNGNSQLAQEDHNYGGVKGEDGNYLHFDNDQQFIDYMSGYYPKYKEDGIYDAKNADEWAEALKHGGYFTAGLEEYEGGMKRHLSEAGLSDGAMSGTPANESGNSDNLGTDNGMISTKQFGDLLDAKLMDFAGTNDDTVHKIFDDMSANTKDKAMVALFAPYMTADANGNMVFANTADNRTQLAGNDAFRKVASLFIQKHLSDYAPAFENGKISIEKAMDALRPQNQQAAQATQSQQAPQVRATVSPQAVLARIQQGLSKPQQAAVLQAANDAVRTPQGMNERDEMAFMNTLSKAIDQHDYPTIAKVIPQQTAQALSMTTNQAAKPVEAPQPKQAESKPAEAAQANVTPLPQPKAQQAEGVRMPTPQENQQAASQAQQTAPTINQARIDELNAMLAKDRQAMGQQYVSTLMQENAASNVNLLNGLRGGDANAIEYAERNFGDILNSTTPAESAAMASRQNTATSTNDVASILRSIPNGEIMRAKTADDGGSVPIQIFQHATRDALRKAGLTYNDENHHNHERVKTAPLYEEAMRRAEQEDNNESNSTQSQQQTSENAENQNQHAEPEQGKTAESQPASETREVSGREKYTSRMNELRAMSEDERKALGKQHYEALKASKTHVSNDLIDDMAKGDPIAIEMVENMYGDKLKAKPEESTKQKDLVSLGNEYADKLEKAKDTIDKYTAQKIGKIVNDYTIQQLRKGEPRTIEQVKGRYFDTLFPEEASKREEARKQERARLLSDVNENGISDHDFFHGFFDNFNNNNRDDSLKIWYKEHLEQKVNYKGKEITAKEFIEESVKNGAKIESKKINPPHGWIEYSIGKHKLMPGEYAYFKYLKENNIFSGKQETKKEAKQPTQDISDTAKEALSGTSKEAQEVYRIVRDKLSKGNDATKRAADVSAIILARHADVYAKAYSKATGTKYTAMDYLHDKIGLDLEGNPVGSNVLYEAMNRGVDVNQLVDVVDITDAVPKISKEISNKELKKYIQDLVRKGTNVFSADKLAGIELKGRNTNHIVYSSFKAKSNRKYRIHAGALHSIEDLLSHSVLIESIPNRKAKKEGKVRAYHRFYVPVRVGDKIETIRLVAEERNGEITVNPAQVDLYDVIVESKKGEPPVATARERAHINTGDSPSKITISDMLAGVKDSDGKNYIQPTWYGSRKHNQKVNGAALGSTSVLANGKRIVSLMESADESTFLHEMGHVFMLDLQDLASIDESAARDMAAVENWTQWKKGQAKEYKGTAWEKEFAEREKQIIKAEQDGDEATASDLKDEWAQERFARGLERYLESGKAPSSALKAVFERFKQFLTKIYEAFKGNGGKPSDDVQNVMARMMDSSVENKIKVPKMGSPIIGRTGREVSVTTDSGKTLKVRYRLVPAGKVITSHDAKTMAVNKAYPQELQPRDRQRVSMQEQVTKMANTLRPADLGAGRNLNQGAPIIRKDGVVLNGNGRAMAIQKHTGTDYKKYLVQHAKEFGFTPEMVRKLNKPMLVREVVGDINADTMQDIISSTAGGSRMGASEQAKTDAKKIKSADLERYVENETGDLTTASNRDFVAGILYRITGENERNAYTDSKANVNADVIQRVKRALFSLAYGDDDLISKMAESTDDNIRNVSNGLMNAAPVMAKANLDMKNGDAHKYDAAKTISDAVKRLDALRQEGKPVKDYLNEQSMFSEYQDTDEMRDVLKFFDENKRSGKKIGTFLREIANLIERQGNPKQVTLGDVKLLTLGQIITKAEDYVKTGDAGESLFTAPKAEAKPAEEKPKKAKKATKKEAPKAEPAEDDSIFGSVDDADKAMLDALGLKEEDLTDDVLTAPAGIENTAAERERLEKALREELEKDSSKTFNQTPAEAEPQAKPKFNPKIYTLGLKLAMTYVKDGINTAPKLVAKLNATFGEEKIGPWAPALAETVRTWPKGVPFDENKVKAISQAVGARYERGITSLDGMQNDMKKLLRGQHETFAPMIEASYNGIKKFFDYQKGESDHVNDSTGKLAERAGRGSDSDAVGPDDAGRESSAGSKRERVQETESEVRPFGSVRVRDGSTASRGTSGDSGVQADKSSNRSSSAGSPHLSGSVRDSYDGGMGTDDGRQADAVKSPERGRNNEGTSRTQKQEVTKKSSKAKGRAGNIESIRKDLPMLKPEQQDDVQFIETRLSVNNKPGVMLTNGTGTGKTYSGLGYIKRLWDDGKKNILIVAPSEEIITQWIDSAKKSFNLDVHQLESTEDKGPDNHICITTYANMQSNKELVNRNWDAVISDESHNLMNNKKGDETGYIKMLRAITLNPRGAIERLRLLHRTKEIRALEKKIAANNREMNAIEKGYEKSEKLSKADAAKMDKLKENNKAYDMEIGEIYRKIMPNSQQMAEDLMKAYPPEKRPKVLFLSATPFAYDHDIDYAEGYLFNYDKDDGGRGYNQGSPRDKFMIQHFGYRMRYNKLTRPEAGVDSRVMEVQFHDNLVNSGAMYGRQLDVDKDYDRGFILVDGGIGHKIDEGFDYLRKNYKFYDKLESALRKQFDKRTQKYLLESIKAQQVIPLVNEYVKEGKKVVLFHQAMKEKENVHPFQLKPNTANADDREVWEQWKRFKAARPDLVELSLNDIPAPMQTLREAFGDNAVYIDGSKEAKKERNQSAARFNDDNSGVNVIICQQDAANAGVSLHDTTGKHPRVLINISMPERPSYAMQIEGRIYRVGNASNAVFRYLSTGTNIEKNMFASTIGGRAESVENLAMGDAARGLHDSFRDLYQETMDGSWKRRLPGNPEEGTGGKEMDKAATSALSEYDRAKSFYYGQQKKTSRSKSQEGRDYFATPEPIGYKMVEWLGLKAGNKALEPSAGHGAISRWFSPNTENTIVEQSDELAPIAQMNTQNAKLVNGSFENFNIVNKFDGIAMNPPYGVGGKTAMEHLRKAISHLRDHGRVIAILPEGPAADKHYNKMMEDVGGNVVEVAQIHLPQVTFNRAGTGVATKIVVLDYFASKREAKTAREDYYTASEDIDLRNIDDINELFDRMENMEVPQRPMSAAAIYQAAKSDASVDEQTQVDAATAEGTPVSSPNFESDTYEHTKTHETLYRARPNGYLGNDYKAVKSLAKRHNGYYSNFANKSFLFHTEEDRNEFVQEADAILGNGKFSAKGKVLDMLKHVEYTADEDLTDREKGIQDFGKQMGMKVVFFDGPSNLNGFHNNGVTFLNRNAANSAPWTFWHESFHWMRNNNPQLYRQMVQYISGKQAFSLEQLSAYREAIGRPELSNAATIEEMMADAMPEVRKRVSFFRDMGKENKGLLQRFMGWIRDTMAAFHNAMSKPKAGLTSTQKNAMRDALANLAADLRDSDGKHIFRVRGKEREIVAADGKELSYEQTPDAPYNDVKFSANAKDDDREQEPAGSPSRIQRALIRLGFAGEKNSNIEIMQKSNKGELNLKDMSVKSVRQVARKNAAVQYMYRLGRKALMEQEHLRNMYAQEMRKFNSYVKKSSNLKEAAQLLWESDAAGHAYTADELDKMGVSLEAGRAYMLARKLLADAYKRVNDARMQVMVRNKVIGRNDLQDFIRSNFLKQEDIIKTERFGNGKIRVTYRGAKVYSKNDAIVDNDEYHKLSADSNVYIKSAVRNADGTYTIDYTERIKPIANREGYMPHFFHNFMVYEKGKNDDGTECLVTIGSANSLKKAIKIAQKASDAKPEGKFVIRPQSMQFDEDYNNVVVGDRDYLKMARQIVGHTEMSWQEANDFLRNTEQVRRTNRHRFFGNAQHRTGAAGFEKDVQWALTHYLNASARYVAMEHFKPDAISFYERFFGAFKDEPKNSTAKYIKEFISDMNGTPRLLEKMANEAVSRIPIIGDNLNDTFEGRPALAVSGSISSFNAITKLGLGNFASAAINFMQFVNIGTKLNSYEYAMKGLKKALKPSAQDKAILEASGVMDEQNMSDEAGGYSQTRDYGRARKGLHAVKYVLNKSMVPFQKADTLMRQAAILGGYYQGVEKMGMKAADGEKLSRAALDYAEDVNLDANFDYSVAAAPRVMRMGSVFTQQLFQFQKYPIMQFEFFWNEVVHAKNNKQRARFLVPYCLLAGAVGAVPFGALMNLVLSSIIGTVGGDGDDYDLAEEIKADMMRWAGKDPVRRRIVNTFLYGMMSNIGINISERVGMSNAFSGEYYGNKPQSAVGAIAQAFGGPLVSTIQNLAQQCQNHNPIEAIKAVSPAIGNILQAFAGETRTTHHRVGTVYNDMWSRVMHGLGFRSTDETNDSFVNNYLYKSSQRAKEDKKDAMDAYIRNPSDENKKRMTEMGVTDKTFQSYKDSMNKSSKQRSQDQKQSKSKKETAAQKESDRLKDFTH